jgi:catechol 2,3-dioxygenase-like lactoylglutathione lyase family enzyme
MLACHTLIYSDDADATRAFFRDVLGLPNVDAGTGDHGYGIVAMLTVPGADDVQLYQPRHRTAYEL